MQIDFTVKPLYVDKGSSRLGKWILHRFQEKLMDHINDGKDTLLVAPTGSGKTLTLLLGRNGAVGVYPNNTLLLDQQKSIHRILTEALDARIKYRSRSDNVDVLRIYEIPVKHRGDPPILGYREVAVVLLSGRYIGYEYGDNDRLIPKRISIIKNIVEKTCYPAKNQGIPYLVTLATPDTALMLMSGIYRDFEKVGYMIHDFLLASAEKYSGIERILSRYRVAPVGELGDLTMIRQCLLKYPWFIDEFHLYGSYEAYGLIPILKVYRDYAGWSEPFILSSATPTGVLLEELKNIYDLSEIVEKGRSSGDIHGMVRGETRVEVVSIPVKGRGVSRWLRVGYHVPVVVDEKIKRIKDVVRGKGRVFIVVDRVNQVPGIVDTLLSHGIKPECSVSIKPSGCSSSEEYVLVGSESISQGIDRSNVRYGIITAYNWASLLQRFGRIGRRVDSIITIVVPEQKSGIPLEKLSGRSIEYQGLAEAVAEELPDIDLRRMFETESYIDFLDKRRILVEYSSTIAFAQVSKPKKTLDKLLVEAHDRSLQLLDLFYGPPEILAEILLFRSSGFPVVVEKTSGGFDETDISTVLRNYRIVEAETIDYRSGGLNKQVVKLRISLEAVRQKIVLESDPARQKGVRPDAAAGLAGRLSSIGVLMDLGYRLVVKPLDGGSSKIEIPATSDVRGQTILLLNLPEELVEAYLYMARGVEVVVGERSLIGLFI